MRSRWAWGFAFGLFLCIPTIASSAEPGGSGPETPSVARLDPKHIQSVVDDLLSRLALPQKVGVAVVPKNPLMLSVESVDDGSDAFLLSLEEDFLGELTDEELQAAIAHELGHVWIFTHHPFLQTEALANRIAMRIVSRESLVQVYEKLWKRQGTKGDVTRFVGD
jgi:hypothetical protein